MSLAVLGSIAGGLFSAFGANKAASAQTQASAEQMGLARDQWKYARKQFKPYQQAGLNYLQAYNSEVLGTPPPTFGANVPSVEQYTIPGARTAQPGRQPGWQAMRGGGDGAESVSGMPVYMQEPDRVGYRVGDREFDTRSAARAYADSQVTGGTPYGGYTKTPGYDFRLNEGLDAIAARQAALGSLDSGETGKALLQYGQDYATSEYDKHLNRLAQGAYQGQGAAGMAVNSGQNFLNTATNAAANRGDAQAAGAVGMANAINGGIGNAIGAWQYQNRTGLNTFQPPGVPWWQGGSGLN